MRLIDLLCVMYAESGCRADRPNALNSGAVGLIQWMPDTLRAIGWTQPATAFLKLNALDQLPYVRRYFLPHTSYLDTLAGVYLAVWMPGDIQYRNLPDFALSQKDGRRGWAYTMNVSLDANGDERITVGELEEAVRRNCIGRRWAEIIGRARESFPVLARPSQKDLGTTYGIQCCLASLGFSPGILDGLPGENTTKAIRSFQKVSGLTVDGIPGPRTRAKLTALAA